MILLHWRAPRTCLLEGKVPQTGWTMLVCSSRSMFEGYGKLEGRRVKCETLFCLAKSIVKHGEGQSQICHLLF